MKTQLKKNGSLLSWQIVHDWNLMEDEVRGASDNITTMMNHGKIEEAVNTNNHLQNTDLA